MAYQLALVDFDGTLVDSMPYWLQLPVDTLRQFRLPQPEGFQEKIRTTPMWQVAGYLRACYPETLGSETLEEGWYRQMEEHYLTRVRILPGMPEQLKQLRAEGTKIYILSATDRPLLEKALEHFDFIPLVDGVYTEQEVGSKGNGDAYRRIHERTGIPYDRILLLEDSETNLRAAMALGMHTMLIRQTGVQRHE